jgi:hypothetical protein
MEIRSAIAPRPGRLTVVAKGQAKGTSGGSDGGGAPSSASHDDIVPRFLGYLLEVRALAQAIKESIDRLRQAASLSDPGARERELSLALAERAAIAIRTRERMSKRLALLCGWMQEHGVLHQWCADQVINIEIAWERVEFHLDRLRAAVEGGKGGDSVVLTATDEIEVYLQRMIFLIGVLTIPGRVNEHLGQLRIGQALDFHRDFADELPAREDRRRLLEMMRSHPAEIDGVVDVERGVIHKTATSRRRQVFSIVLQLLTWTVLGAGLAALAHLGVWSELGEGAILLERYLFVTLGSVLHLALATLKQRRASRGGEVHALDDLLLFVHVREVAIAWTIFAVSVGTVGLSFVSPEASPEAALIVGFSLDSFVDIFLMRLDGAAGLSGGGIAGP